MDHPLSERWRRVRDRIETAAACAPTGLTTTDYLDVAERIVRAATPWQNPMGVVVDPYLHIHASTTTPRFVGALGQLIGFGRCDDLVDACARAFDYALSTLTEPRLAPEFNTKELALAWPAIKDRVSEERRERWAATWRLYRPDCAYNCTCFNNDHNFNTFGLVGEYMRIRAGLGGDMALVERLLAKELRHVNALGMYEDPHCPLTYHAVVLQQWGMLLTLGYDGEHRGALERVVRQGGLTSLFMQSVVGQAPAGGRSNQFHHTEAQCAALFEVCARLAKEDGDAVLAGAFKRAARRSVALIRPWILDMEPYRHLKQGFHPNRNHGTDSYGYYSVYGLLIASLLGIATREADESIEECLTPAECGGYVVDAGPDFHQVFAACGGWGVQVDTRANLQKDATGLSRVQRMGLRPETILSGSIAGDPQLSLDTPLPQRNAAIGPEWTGSDGAPHRLADFSETIESVELTAIEETADRVAFGLTYRGDLAGVREVREEYSLTSEGLRYTAQLTPPPAETRLIVPVIETDGDAAATVKATGGAIEATYRGDALEWRAGNGAIALTDELNANRNAVYRTAVARPTGEAPITLTVRA